ncbi:MAG: NUMOD3 domain-containing DNA-binding protein [bacterium]|jgi:group I intron endonuclease
MIIYKTTNLLNNKIYVGQSKNDDDHYLGSGTYITKAIKKYGKSNFKKEILERCSTHEELNSRELYWIDKLNSTDRSIGYNVSRTTYGIYTEESRKKQGCKGHSEDTKRKISEALRKYERTDEHKEKLLKSIKNIDFSYMKTEEYRNNMSKLTSGEKNGMYGKKHGNNTKEKISKSLMGKEPWNKGKDGSSYYKTMLINSLNKIRTHYNITIEELINNLDLYVSKSKNDGIISKNKGISNNTLIKFGIPTLYEIRKKHG